MRTPRGPSRTLKSLHRTVSTSDVPFVTRRHTRVGIRIRPICCPSSRSSCEGAALRSFTCEPKDLCFALPVRARRALARERLSSYREPASRNPQIMHRRFFTRSCTCAPIRLLSTRAPASGGATNLFPASALPHQQTLRPPGVKDARCVQPMSATQTNYVHPHLARSRFALAAFAAGTPHGVLGSVRWYRGSGRFTASVTASADRRSTRVLKVLASRWSLERGRIGPTALTRSSL